MSCLGRWGKVGDLKGGRGGIESVDWGPGKNDVAVTLVVLGVDRTGRVFSFLVPFGRCPGRGDEGRG